MRSEDKQRVVERGIWMYLSIVFLLTLLAWMPFVLRGHTREHFPLSTFSERFGDIVHFAGEHQKLANPNLEDWLHLAGTMFPRNYGPLAVLVYLFLLRVCSPYAVVVFLAIVSGSLAVSAFVLWRAARGSAGYRPFMALAIFGTSLLAYPTAETALRGNIEGILWIGYAAGVGLMLCRRWERSAVVLGIASCIKPYPAFWLVLMLLRRRYKQAALGFFAILLTSVACLALLGRGNPVLGKARISASGSTFTSDYITGFRPAAEAAGDHSLFETSKAFVRIMKSRGWPLSEREAAFQRSPRVGRVLLTLYLPFAALSVLWILSKIQNQPFLNQIFSMSITLTLFPFIAADYTLTILYVPMSLFLLFLLRDVATGRVAFSEKRLRWILGLCATLMVPLPEFGRLAGVVRSLILLALLCVVLKTPMPMAIDVEEASEVGATPGIGGGTIRSTVAPVLP